MQYLKETNKISVNFTCIFKYIFDKQKDFLCSLLTIRGINVKALCGLLLSSYKIR